MQLLCVGSWDIHHMVWQASILLPWSSLVQSFICHTNYTNWFHTCTKLSFLFWAFAYVYKIDWTVLVFVGAIATTDRRFSESIWPVYISYINCIGTERTIWDCPYTAGAQQCTQTQDASVKCLGIVSHRNITNFNIVILKFLYWNKSDTGRRITHRHLSSLVPLRCHNVYYAVLADWVLSALNSVMCIRFFSSS